MSDGAYQSASKKRKHSEASASVAGPGLTPAQRRQVRTIVKKTEDRGRAHFTVANFTPTTLLALAGASNYSPTVIPQGTTEASRRGNCILIHEIEISGKIVISSGTDIVRLMLLRDPYNDGAAMAPGEFIQNNNAGEAVYSLYQDDVPGQVIWDQTYKVGLATTGGHNPFYKKLVFKKPLKVVYFDTDTTGVTAGTVQGLMTLYATTSSGNATVQYVYDVVFSNSSSPMKALKRYTH